MIRDRNIVCVASSWFDHPTSKHHLMRLLAEQNNILWVNYHASRRPQLTGGDARLAFRRLGRVFQGARRVAPRIDVLSPLLIPAPESRWARRVNALVLARQIRAGLRRLPPWPTQLWLFTPDVPELIGRLRPERVVYYCVDDFAAFSGFNTALVEELERRTLAAGDVVITTSAQLHTERKGLHSNVHLVPHGVDFEHFAAARKLPRAAVPEELRAIARPVLGYMGLVTNYVDLDLVARAAQARPDWSFVFLGEVQTDVRAVANLPNVHLLGGRPYERLPAYCAGFDVGLIPFRVNRLTQAVNPIKLREYLAAGLPVVSAPLPEVRPYAPAVQMAETLPKFLVACERALRMAAEGDAEKRQNLVRAESWQARVETVAQIVLGVAPADRRVSAAWGAQVCHGAAP